MIRVGLDTMMRFEARIPASVANLGPGFDSIGMAVDLFQLRLSLEPGGETPAITATGTDVDRVRLDEDNLICKAINAAYEYAGRTLPSGYHLHIDNEIPMARGLGSSAAAVVGGLLLAREWLAAMDVTLDAQDLIELAINLEGHGDNVVAALTGGVTVTVKGEQRCFWQRLCVTEYPALVLAIPETWGYTVNARRLLPSSVPYADAVYNSAHAALLIAALSSCNYELLGEAMRDRLHEPYREQIYPWLSNARAAALEAGAYGVSLSGAGPSMVAFVPVNNCSAVMRALEAAYHEDGFKVNVYRAAVTGGAVSRTVILTGNDVSASSWSGLEETGRGIHSGGRHDIEVKA